jgi:thioredoxin reductase (NADPH)
VLTGAELAKQEAWPLARAPFGLETSMPGVLAAGDVRHGSVKRVASAVGEGGAAIQQVHGLFAADPLHSPGVDEPMPVSRPLG